MTKSHLHNGGHEAGVKALKGPYYTARRQVS